MKIKNYQSIIILFGFLMLFGLGFGADAEATNRYVRQGASGNGSGSDWANALVNLPSGNDWVRGDIYYIAAGNYYPKGYQTEPENGSLSITIKKATVAEHGTDVGWLNSFASGQAVLNGTLEFTTGYWNIDGVYGGGPDNWTGPFGIKLLATNCGSGPNYALVPSRSGNIFKHLEFVNICQANDLGKGFAEIICGRNGMTKSTIEYSYIHDSFGAYITPLNWKDVTIRYNFFSNLIFTPNWHANVINELGNSDNIDIYSNYFYNNMGGQLTLVVTPPSPGSSDNWRAWNNIFEKTDSVATQSGGVGIWNNLQFYNNTILDFMGSSYGIYSPSGGTGNIARNNIYYNCNGKIANWQNATHNDNWYFNCGANNEDRGIFGSGDPFINQTVHDFRLAAGSSPIDNGMTLGPPFNIDMAGVSRPRGSAWDIGAYEYAGSAPAPYCGDHSCNNNETCSSCSSNCGACPIYIKSDFNKDQKVDIFDFDIFIQNFGQIGTNVADLNSDQKVDIFDFNIFAGEFEK